MFVSFMFADGLPSLQRLYKEKGVNDRHNYTITMQRPELTQAKINAANLSEVQWHCTSPQLIGHPSLLCFLNTPRQR